MGFKSFISVRTLALATASEQVLELYTAMFNRAADIGGLNYWTSEMDSKGWSILDVASSFAEQSEYATAYPASSGNEFFITSIYQNLLGREPDTDGLAYWVGELDSGNIEAAHAVPAIIAGAKSNASAQGILDAQLVANKTEVSDYFANSLGLNDLAEAKSIMSGVTSADDSPSAAQETLNTFAAEQYSADGLGVYEGHKYLIFKTEKNYAEAKAAAEAVSIEELSSLVVVDSAAETDFIFDLLTTNNIRSVAEDGGGAVYAWLGASDSVTEGVWQWVDGSTLNYNNWGATDGYSEPDNWDSRGAGSGYTGQQDYAAIALTDWPVGSAGQWNDVDGVNSLAYVVELF